MIAEQSNPRVTPHQLELIISENFADWFAQCVSYMTKLYYIKLVPHIWLFMNITSIDRLKEYRYMRKIQH